ncbi:MAG TPA: DoxX family protein [Acidimicrobiaceae bacterium]|nr:DoxX family protein [Acidimicrobiaceae bacterium]
MDFDDNTANLALLILRVVFGGTLALHGLAKLRGLGMTTSWFESVGLRPAKMHAWLAGGTETSAGLGLAVGLLTPVASLAFIGVMTTAAWVGHRKNGYSSARNGWELVFVLAVVAAVVALLGPGDWSLDNAVGLEWSGLGGFLFAVIGGVAMSVLTLVLFYRPPAAEGS